MHQASSRTETASQAGPAVQILLETECPVLSLNNTGHILERLGQVASLVRTDESCRPFDWRVRESLERDDHLLARQPGVADSSLFVVREVG